jgi:hypothetical protein
MAVFPAKMWGYERLRAICRPLNFLSEPKYFSGILILPGTKKAVRTLSVYPGTSCLIEHSKIKGDVDEKV